MERRAEVTRDGGLEVERLSRHGMVKRQAEGMQTHALARIILMAIFTIAHYGMSQIGHVDTNLVLAAREQVQEQQ